MSLYEWIQRKLVSSSGATQRPPAESSILRDLGYTLAWVGVISAIAIVSVFALAAAQTFFAGIALIGACGLISLAAASVGGVIGFLFGIPRTLTNDLPPKGAAAQGTNPEARYTQSNTNLEQVSDWLTKVLIGATLVQVKSIGTVLVGIGYGFENTVKGFPGLGQVHGVAAIVIVLVILFFTTGFLALYLQTRTFLAIMFARTERVIGDPNLAASELDVLKEGARLVASEGPDALVPEATRALAQRALGIEPPNLSDPSALKQRGFALTVLGQLSEGATLIKKAYELTQDPDLLRLTSRLLARTDRPGEARDLLAKVNVPTPERQISDDQADSLLTRMFVALYQPPPSGFVDALHVRDALAGQSAVSGSAKRRGRLNVLAAAAFGQSYAYNERTQGDEAERSAHRAAALQAAKDALEADPSVRGDLQNMLSGVGKDNDLESFKNDPAFRALILSH